MFGRVCPIAGIVVLFYLERPEGGNLHHLHSFSARSGYTPLPTAPIISHFLLVYLHPQAMHLSASLLSLMIDMHFLKYDAPDIKVQSWCLILFRHAKFIHFEGVHVECVLKWSMLLCTKQQMSLRKGLISLYIID